MTKQQQPSGAAPLGSRDFYEKVNPYWIQQAASAQARKRARLDKKNK